MGSKTDHSVLNLVLIRKITAHGFKDRSDDSLFSEEDQDQIEDRVIEISVDEDDLDEVTEKTVELAKKRSVLDLLLGFFCINLTSPIYIQPLIRLGEWMNDSSYIQYL